MNCKPGDLAIYVNKMYAGRIFEIVGDDGPGFWFVKPKIRGIWAVADKNLRPIRDPGEDAVDEMLRIAGHPMSESYRAITAPKPQVEFAR